MSISCRRPLITLCEGVNKISIAMGQCRGCPTTRLTLRIESAGCDKYIRRCERVKRTAMWSCGEPVEFTDTRIVTEVVPRQVVVYEVHEVDAAGNAIFILDNKFTDMGPGRYTAVFAAESLDSQIIDIEYAMGQVPLVGIHAEAMGEC